MLVCLLMKLNCGVLVVVSFLISFWCRVWMCLCILVSFCFYIVCSFGLVSMLVISVVLWVDGLE